MCAFHERAGHFYAATNCGFSETNQLGCHSLVEDRGELNEERKMRGRVSTLCYSKHVETKYGRVTNKQRVLWVATNEPTPTPSNLHHVPSCNRKTVI